MAANVPGEHILVVRHVAHMIRIDAAPNATGVIDLGAERRVAKFYERGKAVAQVKRRHHNGVTISRLTAPSHNQHPEFGSGIDRCNSD